MDTVRVLLSSLTVGMGDKRCINGMGGGAAAMLAVVDRR